MSRDIFHCIRLLRALSNLTLNIPRDGACTTSLGNLFQCFTTLTVKKFFLISSLKLFSFSLKPLPLVLLQEALQIIHLLGPVAVKIKYSLWLLKQQSAMYNTGMWLLLTLSCTSAHSRHSPSYYLKQYFQKTNAKKSRMRRNKQRKARWEQEQSLKAERTSSPRGWGESHRHSPPPAQPRQQGKQRQKRVSIHIPLLLSTGDGRWLLAAPREYQLTQMCRVVLRIFSLLWSNPQSTRRKGWCFPPQLSRLLLHLHGWTRNGLCLLWCRQGCISVSEKQLM